MTPEVCSAPKVNVELPPGPEWADATEQLTEHLRAIGDLDRCARVSVRPSGAQVILEISTSDGRTATRRVDNLAGLLRAAEALLVLPPAPLAAAPKPSPQELPPAESRAPRPSAIPPITAHVEFGAGGSLRWGGTPTYVGGGLAGYAQFALDDWLLGVSGRWDFVDNVIGEPTPTDFAMDSNAVGVNVGHRFDLAGAALDTLVGPNIVVETQSADDLVKDIDGDAADLRVSFTVRVSGPRRGTLRAFAASDVELSPGRLRKQRFVDRALPALPSWSSGLAVGVLWGVR